MVPKGLQKRRKNGLTEKMKTKTILLVLVLVSSSCRTMDTIRTYTWPVEFALTGKVKPIHQKATEQYLRQMGVKPQKP